MKHFNLTLKSVLLLVAFMMPWASAQALESFQQVGTINRVNSTTINILQVNRNFRLSTGMSLKRYKVANPTIADFYSGDNIYMKGRILSGVYYVDELLYIPNLEGLAQDLQ